MKKWICWLQPRLVKGYKNDLGNYVPSCKEPPVDSKKNIYYCVRRKSGKLLSFSNFLGFNSIIIKNN